MSTLLIKTLNGFPHVSNLQNNDNILVLHHKADVSPPWGEGECWLSQHTDRSCSLPLCTAFHGTKLQVWHLKQLTHSVGWCTLWSSTACLIVNCVLRYSTMIVDIHGSWQNFELAEGDYQSVIETLQISYCESPRSSLNNKVWGLLRLTTR